MNQQAKINWKQVRAKTGPYPPEAYAFVREGLAHTVKMVHGEDAAPEERDRDRGRDLAPADSHVTGQELCLGLRDYAVQCYGDLARTVLHRWGIRRTDDFGKIVFAMIDIGVLRKADEDSIDDFHGVYDFDEAFAHEFQN